MIKPYTEKIDRKIIKKIEETDISAIEIKPSPNAKGFANSKNLMKDLNTGRYTGTKKPAIGMEIWNEKDGIKIVFIVADSDYEYPLRSKLESSIDGEIETLGKSFVDVKEGEYISARSLTYKKDYLQSIRKPKNQDRDPYRPIIKDMDANEKDCRTILQILFRPIEGTDKARRALYTPDQGFLPKFRTEELHNDRSDTKPFLRESIKHVFYLTNVRVIAVSKDKDAARSLTKNISTGAEKYYEGPDTGQTLKPSTNKLTRVITGGIGRRDKKIIYNTIERKINYRKGLLDKLKNPSKILRRLTNPTRKTPTYMTHEELIALAHPPGQDIDSDQIDWHRHPRQSDNDDLTGVPSVDEGVVEDD